MFEIHDSMELALNITALIPCLILIILYLIDCQKLKYPNYFKLELMFAMFANICLNFVKNYKFIPQNESGGKNYEENKCGKGLKAIGLIQSYLEIVINCLLASFNYLCYILLKSKKIGKKNLIVIILSLISWIIPVYIFILYILKHDDGDFHSISGVCLFAPEIKKKISLYLIPVIFLFDSIFFILTIVLLNTKKKEDEDDSEGYNKHIRRITLNFLSHFFFFFSQYINNAFILFDIHKKDRYQYYNINYHIALTIISIICCIEGKTRDYYNKIILSCLKFEKVQSEKGEDDEEEEDEDDEEDMKIYHERNESEDNNE